MSISEETIKWAYRLFLDREPEDQSVIDHKLQCLVNTKDVRREFLSSNEFRENNLGFQTVSLSGNEPPLFIEREDEIERLFNHIQSVWESFGESEPLWSVLTWEQFKSSMEGTRDEFYKTGIDDVTRFFNTLERNGIDHSPANSCLEFGCGLGRVTCWLAKKYESVIGYDISTTHLRLAQEYFDEKDIQNISLHHIRKPQDLEALPKVDIVFSLIVLQHNPPPLIKIIIRELIRALKPGGVAFLQVPTYRLGYRFSLEEYLSNDAKKSDMEMHVLPQYEVFDIVHKEQGKMVEVLDDGCTGLRFGERSNTFVVKKE